MSAAVITRSSITKVIAGKTRLTISGMRSYFTHDPAADGQPNDGWREVVDWKWSNSDGQVLHGAIIALFFVTAATYTLTLQVTYRNGSTASTSITIVVAAPNVTWRRYVKADGSDTLNDGSIGAPWATPAKAFDAWQTARGSRGTDSFTGEGEILFFAGDVFAHNSRSTVQFGPLNVGVYGGSAHFVLTNNLAASPDGMSLSSDGHDNNITGDTYFNANCYDNFVYWDSCDVLFANQQWYCGMRHVGTQLTNCKLSNTGIDMGGGFVTGSTVYNTEVSGGGRNGVFYSGKFLMLELASIHDTGTSVGFDNCVYQSSGAQHCGTRTCTFDQGSNPVLVVGYNSSGGQYVYVADCLAKGGLRGDFSFPGNPFPDEPGFDYVFDRCVSIDCAGEAYLSQFGGRHSLRNSIAINPATAFTIACSQVAQSGAHETIAGVDIIGCSFSRIRNAGFYVKNGASSYFTDIRMRGCVWDQQSSGTGTLDHALLQIDSVDAPNVDFDRNQWFRTGSGAGSSTFAWIDGAIRSFTYWQGLGDDTNSHYGDPLFVDPFADLHLQAGSPCIDQAGDLGLVTDIAFTARPQGANDDVGAYERVSAEQPLFLTSIDRQFIIV